MLVIFLMFTGLISRVFYLQIVNGEKYLDDFKLQIQKTQEIKATRGNIYDRNGNLLAYNELAFSVTIEDTGDFDIYSNEKKNEKMNKNILDLLNILEKNGDSTVTYLGIILDTNNNFAFTSESETSRHRLIADVYGARSYNDLTEAQAKSTPEKLIEYLCSDQRYDIDMEELGKETALKLVNVRYAMSTIAYSKYLVTTVAKDVSDETVAEVKENADTLVGISVSQETLRRYNNSEYFSSVIGYTGVISTEEYETLSEQDSSYSRNDIVGKAGIEQSMDQVLQGTKGKTTFYVDNMGTVLDTSEVIDPVAGNDLYLTIDSDLQIAVYKILEQKLAGIISKKLTDAMTFDASETTNTNNILIPIGDVYTAMFENLVLDINKFEEAPAGTIQAEVFGIYEKRKSEVISYINGQIKKSSGKVADQGEAQEDYCRFVVDNILTLNGILDENEMDFSDPTYKKWEDEGDISLHDYLSYAISCGWVNTSLLEEYTDLNSKYSDSNEIIDAINEYLNDELEDEAAFDRILYKYMVLDGTISASKVCLLLYEQGVLANDQTAIAALRDGSMDPYSFMKSKINSLEITPAQLGLEPCTASCVVTDPNNGQVLACVSYPGYDANKLANTMDTNYYYKLVNDRSHPLYNNATQEKTAPGSTYKMMTSLAGLDSGVIDGSTIIDCYGTYPKVNPNPKCWISPGAHGGLDVVGALANSCNYFYFDIGYMLGLNDKEEYSSDRGVEKLTYYAEQFGLDQKSGIELVEAAPQVSDSDSVRSAIGQARNNYTTAQLARYTATVANGGTVFKLSLLYKLTDHNGTLINKYSPTVVNEIETDKENWELIQEGMRQMVKISSPLQIINDLGFEMGGKTGTAQQSEVHPDHCLFVGYAPFEDPQIAFSIRIANGYTSLYPAEIGADIVCYYFELRDRDDIIDGHASDVSSGTGGD
ncbi:MAG: penicillin-binding transpeptidase domain-containing protein [Clostridiales bacterium]|nr:penicillin-binding transpeptidase domain-containing protein [Clostridiales bacterium]